MASAEPSTKQAKTAVPELKLSSGHSMPMIGLGTWKSKLGEVKAAVEAAIDVGYRHIDCAAIYGNEAEVGEALKNKFASGAVEREELFITSKLFNNVHKKENVKPACEQTLKDLGLSYLDLYLIHWPHAFQFVPNESHAHGVMMPKNEDGTVQFDQETPYTETWAAMEDLVASGLVRSIGISNFNSKQVKVVCDMCKIKPAMNQVERHPYFDQKRLIEACLEQGIPLTAYCPLGSADNPARQPGDPVLLEDKVLAEIGEKYGKTGAQVALRWQLDTGVVVIPKSVNPARVAQNFDICNFKLTQEDLDKIAAINRDWRCNVPVVKVGDEFKPRDAAHKDYPFNEVF
jgi:diketogulonate reductase-like aldo/keto reductase